MVTFAPKQFVPTHDQLIDVLRRALAHWDDETLRTAYLAAIKTDDVLHAFALSSEIHFRSQGGLCDATDA